MASYYHVNRKLIPYNSTKEIDVATASLGPNITVFVSGNLTEYFGNANVVYYDPCICSSALIHFLYSNPRYRELLIGHFGMRPIGLLANLLLIPKREKLEAIGAFYAQNIQPYYTVGVHIRYGFGREGYFVDSVENVAKNAILCINETLRLKLAEDSRDWRVFLACDNKRMRSIFETHFSHRLVHQLIQATPDHDDKFSVIFDQWMLSLSDLFLGTYPSSLSYIAAARAYQPSFFLSRARKCFIQSNSDAYWPAPSISKVYAESGIYGVHNSFWNEFIRAPGVNASTIDQFLSEFAVVFYPTS